MALAKLADRPSGVPTQMCFPWCPAHPECGLTYYHAPRAVCNASNHTCSQSRESTSQEQHHRRLGFDFHKHVSLRFRVFCSGVGLSVWGAHIKVRAFEASPMSMSSASAPLQHLAAKWDQPTILYLSSLLIQLVQLQARPQKQLPSQPNRLSEHYWWKSRRGRKCLVCASRKGPGLSLLELRVGVDVLQLPVTHKGNRCLQSRLRTIALRQRNQFRSVWIKKINTSGYHPQTDGLVEKFNL